jgi:tetratricopeptide (TPR) repeat protein
MSIVVGMKVLQYKLMRGIFFITVILMTGAGCSDSKETRIQRFLIQGNEMAERRNDQQALEYFNAALELDSCFADALNNIGTIYFNQRDYDEAIRHYDRALACRKDFVEAYVNRANAFYESGELYSALSDLQQLGQRRPDTIVLHLLRGLVYTKLRKYNDARRSFARGLELDNGNTEMAVNLATVYFYQRKYDSAALILNPLAESSQEPNAFNTLALIEVSKKNYQKALEHINTALDLKPGDAFFLNNRGFIYLMLDQKDNALNDINKSIVTDPYNGWAYRNKGVYYLMEKNADEAIRLLTRAEEIDQRIENIYFYLGQAYDLKGDKGQACSMYEQSRQMNEEAASGITVKCK